MQSGKIKHWNQDKGYGFIEVDNQNEDVFFHISKVRLSQPISVGQQVYFNSERNDKKQLRATEVTSTSLSLQDRSDSNSFANNSINNVQKNNAHNSKHQNALDHRNKQRIRGNKKSPFSTLFSLIAIIAVAIYFFVDVPNLFLDNDLQTTSVSSTASSSASSTSTTGDAQIDDTIALIQQGGPYPYPAKDGTTFYNREGRLPAQSSGYYREYTVPTPSVSHRGARRIVTGGNPPTVYYLTVDHYDSFSRLQVN